MGDQGAFRALRSNHKSQLRDLEQQTADRRLEDRDKQADARRASPKSSNIAVFTDVNMVGPRTPYKEVPPGSSRATKNTPNNTGKTGAKNASELKESSPSKKSSTSVLSTPVRRGSARSGQMPLPHAIADEFAPSTPNSQHADSVASTISGYPESAKKSAKKGSGKYAQGDRRPTSCYRCVISAMAGKDGGPCYDLANSSGERCFRCACGGHKCFPCPPEIEKHCLLYVALYPKYAGEPDMIAFAEAIKKHLKHHYPKLDMNKDRTHFLWSPQFLSKFNPPAAPSVSPEMIDLANFVAAQDPAPFAHLSEFLEAEAFMIQEQKLRASQGQQARERLEQERTGKVALNRYRQAKITETKLEQHGKASDSLIDREGTTSGHSSTVVINGKRFIQIPDDPAPSFASTPLLPGIEAHAQSAFPRHDPPPNGGYGAYGPSASAANLSSLSPTVRTVLEESAPTFKNTGDELVSRTRQIEARNARRSQELSSKGTKRHFYTGLGIASKRPKTAAAPIEELNGSPEVLADPVIDEDPLGPVAVTKTKRGGDTVLNPEYISSHHSSDIVEHADQATHGVVEDTPEDQEADFADKSSISSTEEDPTLVDDLKEVLQRYGEVLHDFVAVVRREAREAVRAVVREELRKEREQNTE